MPISRPTVLPTFATDSVLTGGPQAGLSTRLDPGTGVRAQGIYQGRRVPARALGWVLGVIGDWLGYLDDRVLPFVNGGTVSPTGTLNIDGLVNITGAAGLLIQHDVTCHGAASFDGSLSIGVGLTAIGVGSFVRAPIRIVRGDPSSGTHIYGPLSVDEVFNDASTPIISGCIWQIDPFSVVGKEKIIFTNMHTVPVQIQDPSGATIVNLSLTSAHVFSAEVTLVSGVWTMTNFRWRP